MPEEYYLNKLYPFQDKILRGIHGLVKSHTCKALAKEGFACGL
jgi:hypothetical protein